MTTGTSPIGNLPAELFDLVAAHLDLLAFKNLRICSRRLHLLSLAPFAKRHFARLTTTLGSASLDRLVQIASHHHFSPAVTTLHVRFLYYTDYCDLESITRLGIYPPPKRFAVALMPGISSRNIPSESTLYKDICGDSYPQCIVDRLVCALEGFPNIKTMKFYTRLHHRGDDQGPCDRDDIFRMRCFQAVITAIARSNIELRELSISKGSRKRPFYRCLRLPCTALCLPPGTLQALKPRLCKLTSLTLSIDSSYLASSHKRDWELTLTNLLASTPLVKNLALSLDYINNLTQYGADMMHSLALSCRLMVLSSFVLSNCTTYESDLTTFFAAQASSVSQLEMVDVRLCSGSWRSVLIVCKSLERLEQLRLATLKGPPHDQYLTLSHRCNNSLKVTLDVRNGSRRMSERIDDLIGALYWEI